MADRLNDVNLEAIMAVDKLVREQPPMGKCQFKAKSTWQRGTKSQVTISGWSAGRTNMSPAPRRFTIMVDEPAELGGVDGAPNPVEVLLSALAGCVTAGIATNAQTPEEKVRKCKETIDRKSPVRDTLANPVNVTSTLVYKPR